MAEKTAEKLINFAAYAENERLLGMVDVELPTIEALSETIRGAGIAGEMDSPTLGHIGPMSTTLKWRQIEPEALELLAPKVHALELRGSVQRYNGSAGEYETEVQKYVLRVIPKSAPLGTLAPAAVQEPTQEFSVRYLKIFIAGRAKLEIDPMNYIYIVDGVDYLSSVRTDLGV